MDRQRAPRRHRGKLTQFGTLAGALMGLGLAVMTDPSEPILTGLIAAGGLGGLALTVGIADPQRGGARTGMRLAPKGRLADQTTRTSRSRASATAAHR